MTSSKNQEISPWWETELPTIRDELVAYLRHHVPALHLDHDDLLSDTLLSLTQHVRGHVSTLPKSWFSDNWPTRDEQSYLHKLGIVILKRRIADNFRRRLTIKHRAPQELTESIADPNSVGQEHKIMLARILDVVHLALDGMPPEDRDLIELSSQGLAFRTVLSPRDRRRLSRIRQKLRAEIALRLGSNVADLLGAH